MLCPARRTILGIPITKSPVTIEFDWPTNASSARILCGGIGGFGEWDTMVCLIGALGARPDRHRGRSFFSE
jgi:hypothetical protein